MRTTVFLASIGAIALAIVSTGAPALAKDGKTYTHLIVQDFEVPADADFPADFKDALRRNVVKHLQDTGRFLSVTLLDPGQPAPADADISLTGKIVKFKKGNRAERYMAPGMGQTSIRAWIEFTDTAAGKSLLKKEVSGKVVIGFLGGDSKGATNGLAKGLAKSVKKSLP